MVDEMFMPKGKTPCEVFDATIEDKIASLLAAGRDVPTHLFECYVESKKLKELKAEGLP